MSSGNCDFIAISRSWHSHSASDEAGGQRRATATGVGDGACVGVAVGGGGVNVGLDVGVAVETDNVGLDMGGEGLWVLNASVLCPVQALNKITINNHIEPCLVFIMLSPDENYIHNQR